MAFYGYNGDVDERYWTPYSGAYNYDSVPAQSQASPAYEYGQSELVEYESSAYHRDDSFVTPELNYSVYSYSESKLLQYDPIEYHSSQNYYEYYVHPSEISFTVPKLLQYDPPPYDRGYFPSETKFTISYSTVEFNEPEFEEYDPTPYGGGYDPVTTYGKPLPPSEITCYPRSVPRSNSIPLENFPYASIPSPYGKDDELPKKPPNGIKPIDTKIDIETCVENGDKVASNVADVEIDEPSDVISDYDDEHENGSENGIRGNYGYESERQVSQIPYGSGLETLDICESIFGYWPCLAKIEQQQRCRQVCDQEIRMNPWKSAADYLFGSPLVYDYENYHHHHHQQQAQYEYYENSWLK